MESITLTADVLIYLCQLNVCYVTAPKKEINYHRQEENWKIQEAYHIFTRFQLTINGPEVREFIDYDMKW